jgi:hypothetical protein
MSYVNCPRCRLTVRLRHDSLTPEFCPRCAAKHGVQSKVYLSPTPARLFRRPEAPVVPDLPVEVPRAKAPA